MNLYTESWNYPEKIEDQEGRFVWAKVDAENSHGSYCYEILWTEKQFALWIEKLAREKIKQGDEDYMKCWMVVWENGKIKPKIDLKYLLNLEEGICLWDMDDFVKDRWDKKFKILKKIKY